MSAVAAYEKLVEKGCLCGTDDPAACTLHGPGNNRGIAAFYRAGMPRAFPMEATCTICKADGLMFPDVELDDPDRKDDGGPPKHRPTLICPRCSTPANERHLRAEVEAAGLHVLNEKTVFGMAA